MTEMMKEKVDKLKQTFDDLTFEDQEKVTYNSYIHRKQLCEDLKDVIDQMVFEFDLLKKLRNIFDIVRTAAITILLIITMTK